MHFNTLLYSFMIKIIVTKAQVKHINIRMLRSTCVDECHNYQFAICFPGYFTKFLRLQTMLEKNTCFSNINFSPNFEEIAKVKEPELINNVTFSPIYKSISRLDTMILMVYDTDIDPSNTQFILCETSRNLTKNGINVTFVDYFTPDSTMRYSFEILIEAVCEKEDCHGEMCDICGTTTEQLPTTDISTSTEKTTHLSIKATHSIGHTRDTSTFTTIQITNIAESTTHANTKSDVSSTLATTTRLLPTTDSSTSGDTTTTRLSTQTTYSTGHPGNTINRPTKQSEKYTASTTHSNTKTDIASTSHISTLTKIFSSKTTSNATKPAISKRSTSHGFTTSSKRRSSTTLANTTPYIKYIDSTIPSSRTVTEPITVTYSNAKNSLSNPVIINEEVENSKNVRAWAITTTAVGIVQIIIIVLLIVYIRRLKIQKRTTSSSQESISHL